VTVGMAALTGKGLAGRVSATTETTATVQLVTGVSSAVSVRVRDKNIFGIAYGNGTDMVRIKSLATAFRPKKGDDVVTSGYGIFPPGVPVGAVERVVRYSDRMSPTILISPSVDSADLYYVLLVKM